MSGGIRRRRSRRFGSLLGALLFAAYGLGYAAFVGVAAFGTFAGGRASGGLASPAFGGLPWGVVAGFLLIVGAFAIAVVYAAFAPPPDGDAPTREGEDR